MRTQYDLVIQDKIAQSVQLGPPHVSARDVVLPKAKQKAIAVIGMRRAGKTSYLHQCRADLLLAGRAPESLVYFNFEDERLVGFASQDLGRVVDVHARMYPEAADHVTLFLDEIQIIPGWEVFVRRMLDTPGYDIFLSGCSAKLLSREIATSMRGRAWELPIYPFSFGEFARFHDLAVPDNLGTLTSRQAAAIDHNRAAP